MAVYKRGGRWAVTVYDPAAGDKRWVGTFDRKTDAEKAEAQAKIAHTREGPGEVCDSFAARWTTSYSRSKASTNQHNAERVAAFGATFKGRRMDSITRLEARRWALVNSGRISAVRAMFSDAVRDGIATTNPFTGLRSPQSRGRKDLVVPTVEQVADLADLAHTHGGPGFHAFVLAAAYTGMRPGELYALRWPQLDLEHGLVDVVAAYSSKSKETTTPKNGQSRRIVVPPPAALALEQLPRGNHTVVFRTSHRRPLTGRVLHYYWDRVRVAGGKPTMAFYELRHFCGSYLLNDLELAPQDVAHQLGHTDGGGLVMRLYGHPSEELARRRIQRAFGSSVVALRPVPEASAEATDRPRAVGTGDGADS